MWKASVHAFNECSLKVNKLVVRSGSVALRLLLFMLKMPQAANNSNIVLLLRCSEFHLPNKPCPLIFNHPLLVFCSAFSAKGCQRSAVDTEQQPPWPHWLVQGWFLTQRGNSYLSPFSQSESSTSSHTIPAVDATIPAAFHVASHPCLLVMYPPRNLVVSRWATSSSSGLLVRS